MNEGTINAEAQALATGVRNQAATDGAQLEANLQAKAAGLSTGSFAPGGYTYQRINAPVVEPLANSLVLAAKQAIFRQAAKNAMNDAQVGYDAAKQRMQDRQLEAQRQAKAAAEARQREYERSLRAQYSGGGSSGGGGGGGGGSAGSVAGFKTVSTGAPANLKVGTANDNRKVVVNSAPDNRKVVVSTAKPKQTSIKVSTAKDNRKVTVR